MAPCNFVASIWLVLFGRDPVRRREQTLQLYAAQRMQPSVSVVQRVEIMRNVCLVVVLQKTCLQLDVLVAAMLGLDRLPHSSEWTVCWVSTWYDWISCLSSSLLRGLSASALSMSYSPWIIGILMTSRWCDSFYVITCRHKFFLCAPERVKSQRPVTRDRSSHCRRVGKR